MNFASDNASGASEKVLAAMIAANAGFAMPYGADALSGAAERAICDLFERDCSVFLVPTGTAANALALACLTPPWGAIFCHHDAHIMDDECGAPEFYSDGAKLIGLPGDAGKIEPDAFETALRAFPRGVVKQVQPAALSLTQATESGTLYKIDEIAHLSAIAHAAGVSVHMDGARFANAIASSGLSPAEMSWKAGVDVLSFGATKNGTLCCEAVVFFDKAKAADIAFRRKRAGQTLSKSRFLAAQMLAYLDAGHWLELATFANERAAALVAGLSVLKGVSLPWQCEANEVFAIIPRKAEKALIAAGAGFYNWGTRGLPDGFTLLKDDVLLRLVTSFATSNIEVDGFVKIVREAL
jgi:threonine aldolase